MKSTIILLVLVALTFTTNAKATNEFKVQDLNQQEVTTFNVEIAQQQDQLACVNDVVNTTCENTTEDTVIFSPNTVLKTTYIKTVEEVIAENKLITETKEESIQPLSIATTKVDQIAEDNKIIESVISNEVYSLDFEKINRSVKNTKTTNNNLAVSVDIKL
jgi:stage III sporulation protein SpoIIIAA